MKMGRLVAVEGMDASGKATQTKRLRDRVVQTADVNADVMLHDFPHYQTETGQSILGHLKNEWDCNLKTRQRDLETLAGMVSLKMYEEAFLKLAHDRALLNARVRQSLFLADKCEWAGEIIRRLNRGDLVILDRYWASGYVYGAYDGLSKEWLEAIHSTLPQPDYYFYIDIPVEESIRRRPERRDQYESNMECLTYVRKAYRELFERRASLTQKMPGKQWYIIDGMGTEDEVHARIWDIIGNTF